MKKIICTTLAIATSLALAAAAMAAKPDKPNGSPNNPKADIQQGNAYCGVDLPELPVIGFVNYHRQGDTVAVQFHLKGGAPNEEYIIELWGDDPYCNYLGSLGSVTTNNKGVANLNGTIDIPSHVTMVFATGLNYGAAYGYHDTPLVELF